MPTGTIQIYVSAARGDAPLPGARVTVSDESGLPLQALLTDASGAAGPVTAYAPDRSLSLDEDNTQRPYGAYRIAAALDGWQAVTVDGVQVFDGQQTTARLSLLPANAAEPALTDTGTDADPSAVPRTAAIPENDAVVVIPPHPLFAGTGGSGPQPQSGCPAPRVLTEVVVPKNITVHLGKPSANVRNVTVPFQEYIANVASSEVYPTWPEQALRANIIAQVSLALNRVWTEWYPSRGYSFNITGSPGYDQAYQSGRTIFAVMERLTAELFSTYVRRTGDAEPYFTEYCDGKTVTCPGMKQWGTVDRANEGLNALQILRYYYGSRVQLVTTNNIASIPSSWGGVTLRRGSTGTSVRILQKQLSRIAKDYPSFGKPAVTGTFDAATESSVRAFQKQFGLTADGVVGRATWYKISYIYVSVKDLAELTSEGETLTGEQSGGAWPGVVLRRGSTGRNVELVQFWLSSLAQYSTTLPDVAVDGNYGAATERAVTVFQRQNSLTADGVVGQATWDALYKAWVRSESDIGGTAWPGTVLRQGSRGAEVRLVQLWLRIAADNYSALNTVTVDGTYGAGTAAAVTAFQQLMGLTADGAVGRATWNKLSETFLSVVNGLVGPDVLPGQFTGTLRRGSTGSAVRALQSYLRQLAAYYTGQPDVTVDGTFGPATETAVTAWQRRAGLTADGVVGPLTWQSIYDNAIRLGTSGPVARAAQVPVPASTLTLGDSGEEVRKLSEAMLFLSHWLPDVTIWPDGQTKDLYDAQLQTAVESAQRTLGLPVTGSVTPADWRVFYNTAAALYGATPAAASPEPAGIWPGYALARGSAGPAVLQVQQWLNRLAAQYCGLEFVPETAELDDDTQRALEVWQLDENLSPLGLVDDETWEALQSAAACTDCTPDAGTAGPGSAQQPTEEV